jgi:hypothetical protein
MHWKHFGRLMLLGSNRMRQSCGRFCRPQAKLFFGDVVVRASTTIRTLTSAAGRKMMGERRAGNESCQMLGRKSILKFCAQILATAKRSLCPLPVMEWLRRLFSGAANLNDESGHLPLLAWWALESKAEKEREAVFGFLKADLAAFLQTKLFRDHLAEKLAKRYALAGGEENLNSCAELARPHQR